MSNSNLSVQIARLEKHHKVTNTIVKALLVFIAMLSTILLVLSLLTTNTERGSTQVGKHQAHKLMGVDTIHSLAGDDRHQRLQQTAKLLQSIRMHNTMRNLDEPQQQMAQQVNSINNKVDDAIDTKHETDLEGDGNINDKRDQVNQWEKAFLGNS